MQTNNQFLTIINSGRSNECGRWEKGVNSPFPVCLRSRGILTWVQQSAIENVTINISIQGNNLSFDEGLASTLEGAASFSSY